LETGRFSSAAAPLPERIVRISWVLKTITITKHIPSFGLEMIGLDGSGVEVVEPAVDGQPAGALGLSHAGVGSEIVELQEHVGLDGLEVDFIFGDSIEERGKLKE
jgi:hypothetical protein